MGQLCLFGTGRRVFGMDMISHILQLDKEAEERINSALEQSERKKQEALEQQKQIEQQARESAERTKEQIRAETDKSIEAQTLRVRTKQRTSIKALDDAFEKEHESWENSIFEEIVSVC